MSPSENPRTASELCDWLEANRRVVSEAIRQVPAEDRRSARSSWIPILDRLEGGSDDEETFDDVFGSFLETLFALPGVGRILPGGFNGYLLPGGRQPTRRAAHETCRKFKAVLNVLNEDVRADDEEETRAVPPAASPAEGPRIHADMSTPREARP